MNCSKSTTKLKCITGFMNMMLEYLKGLKLGGNLVMDGDEGE